MPANDREVFDYFRNNEETSIEIDHLAYAAYAFDKYEWMKHFEALKGKPPTIAEENEWISQLPETRLNDIRVDAYRFFEDAARSYMRDEIEAENKKAINSSILREIRQFTSFGHNWLQNIFLGIVASFAFSIIVIIMGVIFAHDPSPIALYKEIAPSEFNHPQK